MKEQHSSMRELAESGRLRGIVCGIISFAPFLASVSVLSLGALLAMTSPVRAKLCTGIASMAGEGKLECTGGATQVDKRQDINVGKNSPLTLANKPTFAPDFNAETALNRGIGTLTNRFKSREVSTIVKSDGELDSTVNNGLLVIMARAEAGINEALYETLPAVLAQLANLESYQQRIRGRVFENHDSRVFGKVLRSSGEVEPNSTNLATYDIGCTSTQFGFEIPLRTDGSYIADNFAVGISIAFVNATTDVSVSDADGKITTDGMKFTIHATQESDKGFYVDEQFQYTSFKNDIKMELEVASTDASALSAGAEVGWNMEFEDFFVTPSVQIAWTNANFKDFVNAAGTPVTLDDGNILTGRLGVAVEREWSDIFSGDQDFSLRGYADLLALLEGEVVTNVGGMKIFSERKEPSIEIGVGISYVWGGTYTVLVDASTQQGGKAEGYAGSIGFKYGF